MTSALPIGLSRYIDFDVLYARQGTVSKLKHKVLDFYYNLFTKLNLWSSWNVSPSFCILIRALLIILKNSLQPVPLLPPGFEPSTYGMYGLCFSH